MHARCRRLHGKALRWPSGAHKKTGAAALAQTAVAVCRRKGAWAEHLVYLEVRERQSVLAVGFLPTPKKPGPFQSGATAIGRRNAWRGQEHARHGTARHGTKLAARAGVRVHTGRSNLILRRAHEREQILASEQEHTVVHMLNLHGSGTRHTPTVVPLPYLQQDWARPTHICSGPGHTEPFEPCLPKIVKVLPEEV